MLASRLPSQMRNSVSAFHLLFAVYKHTLWLMRSYEREWRAGKSLFYCIAAIHTHTHSHTLSRTRSTYNISVARKINYFSGGFRKRIYGLPLSSSPPHFIHIPHINLIGLWIKSTTAQQQHFVHYQRPANRLNSMAMHPEYSQRISLRHSLCMQCTFSTRFDCIGCVSDNATFPSICLFDIKLDY